MNILEALKEPWPWYVAGPMIGLVVPILLLIGNKSFGISSSLRHICAACFPANISFFKYDWKKEVWNLLFVLGIFIGGVIAASILDNPNDIILNPKLTASLANYGITEYHDLMPGQVFSWANLLTMKGIIMMVGGGFLIGFGTRYGGGCTSGHAIMGLSTLQWPSLVATCCFMLSGIFMANFILPFILSL